MSETETEATATGDLRARLASALARGAAVAFTFQVAGTGLRYLTHVAFARFLGPAGYGVFAYAFSWTQLLSVVAALGFPTAVLRFVPAYLASGDHGRLRGLVGRARWLVLGASLAIGSIGTLIVLTTTGADSPRLELLAALWIVPLPALVFLHEQVLRGTKRLAAAYVGRQLVQPLAALGLISAAAATGLALQPLHGLGAMAAAMALVIAVQLAGARVVLPAEVRTTPAVRDTRAWLSVSLPLLVVGSFVVVLSRADVIMLGLLLDPTQAGIYNAAARTATLVSFVLAAVNALAAPMIAELHARGDIETLQHIVTRATRWMFFPSLAVGAGLVVLGEPILGLFGPNFTAGRTALIILVAGHLVNAAAGPVGYLVNLTGHERTGALAFGVAAGVNVALNAWFIPKWGMLGVAAATASAMALWNVWLVLVVRRRLGIGAWLPVRGWTG